MKRADIDRVFGRGRLRMVTGDHVEVFREQSMPGERRRYTKRFLATAAGDFSEWTEREWRILARLVGHGIKPVPDVVRFDRGAADRPALVQTYDAGVTVDHWATLLPLERDGTALRNVFEDCAHWWALARHSLLALDAIHELHLVHLDLKADNVCIPVGPVGFDPHAPDQVLLPRFDDIALIDFAFSLVSGERLNSALPIARQADYEYQSPRLLQALDAGRQGDLAPTRLLDWRCDLFSLAAMLWRYLPELEDTTTGAWTRPRHARARALVRRLIEAHDAELPAKRPHAELIAFADEALAQPALQASLQRGWTLAVESGPAAAAAPTPVTRIALPVTAPVATLAAATAAAAIANAKSAAAAKATPITRPVAPAPASASASSDETAIASAHESAHESAIDAAAGAVRASSPASPPATSASPSPSPSALSSRAPSVAATSNDVETLAVDPTDVAIRIRARRRDHEHRARRLTWAGAIAATALIATGVAAWLEPAWLAPSVARDVDLAPVPSPAAAPAQRDRPSVALAAPAPQAPTTRVAAPPVSSPVEAETTAPPLSDGTRAAIPPGADASVSSTASPTLPLTVDATPAPAAREPAAPTPARASSHPTQPLHVPRGRAAEPAPARTALAPGARHAMAFPARGARASAQAGRSPRGTTTLVSRRPPSARAWTANGASIPWAVAGRGAPRTNLVAQAGAGERGALQPSPAALASIAAIATRSPAAPVDAGATATAPTALAVVARPSLGADMAPPPAPSPPIASAAFGNSEAAAVDYAARAGELMTQHLPRIAQRAERLVARVLYVAGRAERVSGDDEIRAAAAAIGRDGGDALAGLPVAARESQRLGDAARNEYGRRGATPAALALQARAFGADPLDAEAAGNLAFLLLRSRPAQPEAARQLALHALTLHGIGQPTGRIEDWATFAIASALSGRERDAKNAFLVMLSLAPNLDQQCRAALDVYTIYGERLRMPVESMLRSASASGRVSRVSACDWPPRWVVSGEQR